MSRNSRTSRNSRHTSTFGLALLLLSAGTPAVADWLVTKDGARIETKGAWRVDGKRVLFDLPNGTLSAIRVDEVDLDRSAVATADARAGVTAEAKVAEPKREPVLRLTDKDIPPSPQSALEEAEGGTAAPKPENAVAAFLEVISWEKTETPDGSGVEVFGTIRNESKDMATSPSLLVAVYDSDGGLLATANGIVNSPSIPAGKTANFRVTFSGLTDFAAIKFDPQAVGFRQRSELDEEGEEILDESAIEETYEPPSPPDA